MLSEKCKELVDKEDINKRVFFLGSVPNASYLLPYFDIFILSSLVETFGIVAIEAILNKIPIIASDIEIMKTMSNDNQYFALFETGNPIDLKSKIEVMINSFNSLELSTKLEKAYQYFSNKYNYENYIGKLYQFYNQ